MVVIGERGGGPACCIASYIPNGSEPRLYWLDREQDIYTMLVKNVAGTKSGNHTEEAELSIRRCKRAVAGRLPARNITTHSGELW